jgi:hypothetical protein
MRRRAGAVNGIVYFVGWLVIALSVLALIAFT